MIKCTEELKECLLTGDYLNEEVKIVFKTKTGVNLVFNDKDVKVGGLSWSKEASDKVGFELGWCDTTEVNIELLKQVKEPLYESEFSIYFTYKLPSGNLESWKVGSYYVPKGNVTIGVDSTKITAFSNTGKLKKKIETGVSGSLYDLLVWACTACEVVFGMTKEEFDKLSPATKYTYKVDLSTSIKNYSDVVMWISQVVGGFVDCNVDGEVVIRTFGKAYQNDYLEPIPNPDWVYGLGYVKDPEVGSSSYIVSDIAIKVGEFTQYKTTPNKVEGNYFNSVGYNYIIDNNPILEVVKLSPTQFDDIYRGMKANVEFCNFREMENFILDNPFFELGDVVFSRDKDGVELASCITSFKYTYNGNAVLSCCPLSDLYTQEKQSTQSASKTGGSSDYEGAVLNIIKTALVKDKELGSNWESLVNLDVLINAELNPIFSFLDCVTIKESGKLSARVRYDGVYTDSTMELDVYKFRENQSLALLHQWVLKAFETEAVHNIVLEAKYEAYDSTIKGNGALLRSKDWGSYLMCSGAKQSGAVWTGVFDVTDEVDFSFNLQSTFGLVEEGVLDCNVRLHNFIKNLDEEVEFVKTKTQLGKVMENNHKFIIMEHDLDKDSNTDLVLLGKTASVFGNIEDSIDLGFI